MGTLLIGRSLPSGSIVWLTCSPHMLTTSMVCPHWQPKLQRCSRRIVRRTSPHIFVSFSRLNLTTHASRGMVLSVCAVGSTTSTMLNHFTRATSHSSPNWYRRCSGPTNVLRTSHSLHSTACSAQSTERVCPFLILVT